MPEPVFIVQDCTDIYGDSDEDPGEIDLGYTTSLVQGYVADIVTGKQIGRAHV